MWKTILKFVNNKMRLFRTIKNNIDSIAFFRLYLT